MTEVYILAATRSAIGSFGGALAGMSPVELGAHIARAAIEKSGIKADGIGHAVIGHVIPTEPRDSYIARCISIASRMAESAPALTVNRLCGSGLEAVAGAARMIMLGETSAALAGGVEVMSRGGHLASGMRQGQGVRMGDAVFRDMMLGALTDPFGGGHMGITAENIAQDFNISREEQDAFALASQRKAADAISQGRFTEQITPVPVGRGKAAKDFSQDEYPRADSNAEKLASLKPAFKEGGSVTAGNAAGINDGAAMLVLADAETAQKHDPLARIIGIGTCGVPPRIMGMGPVPASKMALERAGIGPSDLAVVESNEAFAAQCCAILHELGIDKSIVNPNGGAIALGHPIGATGAIILVKLVHELRRIKARYGMATMCIGGGQGISIIVDTKGMI